MTRSGPGGGRGLSRAGRQRQRQNRAGLRDRAGSERGPAVLECEPVCAQPRTAARSMAAITERTFIAIKPDGVQRRLVGEIIRRFERKGFKLVAMKLTHASEDLLREHYIDLKERPFYAGLVQYMHSGPVVAMVWEGLNVIKTGRVMLGETNPMDSKPGTIRGDLCVQVGRNIIHGSDSLESAEAEINLWFTPEELVDYRSCAHEWIYE
ncbi:nucleoside diphosphate kinase A-like [Coturnix japonica]|nr:nucleoside diphosphate kinase A-like [Coturnix japonica]